MEVKPEEEVSDSSFEEDEVEEPEEDLELSEVPSPKRRRLKKGKDELSEDESSEKEDDDIFDDNYIVDKLPEDKDQLRSMLTQV